MSSTSGGDDGNKIGSMLNVMSSASSGDVCRNFDRALKAMASILGIDNNRKMSNGRGSSSVEEADQGGNRKMRKGRRSPSMEGVDKGGEISLKKGTWTQAEDAILKEYVEKHGEGNWNAVQKNAGLARCGKSCRFRWANHLRPDLKKGAFTKEEEQQIADLHAIMGNKWSQMAAKLPGRTDNEIKNFWNTRIKRLRRAGLATYPDKTEIYRQQVSNGSQENLSLDSLTNEANRNDNVSLTENLDIPDVSDMVTHLDQSTYTSLYNMLPMMHPSRLFQHQGSDMIHNSFDPSAVPAFDQYDTSDPRLLSRYHPIVSTSDQFGNDLTGSHADLNGNISASSDPIYGAFKVELPSFQYFEAQKCIWATAESSLPPLIDVVDTPESSIQFQPNQSLPDSFQYFEAHKRIWAMPESSLPPLIEAVDTPESSIQFQPNHHLNNDGLLEPVLYGFKNLNDSNNVGSFQENNVDSFQENNDHCILNEEVLRSSLGPFAASVQWDEPEALRSSLGPFAASVQSDEPETLRSSLGPFAASVQSDEPEALRSSSLGPFAASVQADYTNITNCMYSMETTEDHGDEHGTLTEFQADSPSQENQNLIEFLNQNPILQVNDNCVLNEEVQNSTLNPSETQWDEQETLRSSIGPFAASEFNDYTNINNCICPVETTQDAGDKHVALTEFPYDSSSQEDLNLIEFLLDPDLAPDLSFMDNIYFNGDS